MSTKPLAFIPLESNPQVFNSMAYDLGLSTDVSFVDVYSISDPDLLGFVPRPAYALILVFPVSEVYENVRRSEDADRAEYEGAGEGEPVVWFKQTIRNACGMMGLVHAMVNGSRSYIAEGSTLDGLLKDAIPLKPVERAKLLETSRSLADAHQTAGLSGDTEAPAPEDNIDLHFVCFVKSEKDNHIYELDGRRKGPLDRGEIGKDDDILGEAGRNIIKGFLEREGENSMSFGLVALVKGGADI